MNAAAKVLPLTGRPVYPSTPAERMWVESHADLLIHGADVKFKRRGKAERSVTHAEFLTQLQFHLNERQEAGEDQDDFFAQIVLSSFHGQANASVAGYLIGTARPRDKLFEIAEGLLRPMAADGVIAQREDDEI